MLPDDAGSFAAAACVRSMHVLFAHAFPKSRVSISRRLYIHVN